MSRTRLILHIGTHKTGSTSLQAFLRRNRRRHLRKWGLYYPVTDHGGSKSRKHALLSASIHAHRVDKTGTCEIPPPESVIRLLADDILASGAHTAVISAEGLSRPSPRFAGECAALSAYFDVEVVVFLRRQDLFAESLHKQFVRDRGETRTIEEFITCKGVTAWLDYRRILSHWESVFGPEAITVIPFERTTLEQGVIQAFVDRMGLSLVVKGGKARNISPNREMIEILRRINRFALTGGMNAETNRQRRRIVRTMRDLQMGTGCAAMLGEPAREALLQRYRAGNAEIASRYLGRTDGRLFLEDIGENGYPAETWCMTDGEAVEHLVRLVCHLSGSPGRNLAQRAPANQAADPDSSVKSCSAHRALPEGVVTTSE